MTNIITAQHKMDDACRGIRHSAKEYIPYIRGTISLVFLAAAEMTDGGKSAAFAVAAALPALSAIKSVAEDFKFWGPSISRFYEAKAELREAQKKEAAHATSSIMSDAGVTPPSP